MCETDSSTDPDPDPDPGREFEFESMSAFEREALLTDYRERRKAIRSHLEITQRRISQGLIAIGFVIGYSLLAPNSMVFLSVVPLMIAILYLMSMQSMNNVFLIGRYVYDLEAVVPGDVLKWEHRYGGFSKDNDRRVQWSPLEINLIDIPNYAVQTFTMLAYFGFIGVAIVVVDRQFPDPVFGFQPAVIAAVGYALLTTVLVGVLYSFSIIHEAIQTGDSG